MATKVLKLDTSNGTFPSIFYYLDKGDKPNPHVSFGFIWPHLRFFSVALRDAFYLPLYQKTIASSYRFDQTLAKQIADALSRSQVIRSLELDPVRNFFSIRDIPVRIKGVTFRTFTVRLFESKMPIQEKKLRIILFVFNGNTEAQIEGGTARRWEPLSIRDLSDGPLSVLRALNESCIKVDSLVTASLGNVIFDGLKTVSSPKECAIIPKTLIINRGLTSVQKVANQLYSYPLNYLLYGAAQLLGWDANPEQELLNFIERDQKIKRKVIIIEALKDFYFSGKGGFEPDFHVKMIRSGASVFRAGFFPFPYHIRSHHALPLDHLVNNSVTDILANTIPSFSFPDGEKMSSAIAREVFYKGNEEFHTCFYVAGNDATLDVATARDVTSLLSAFIEEGQKMNKSSDAMEVC